MNIIQSWAGRAVLIAALTYATPINAEMNFSAAHSFITIASKYLGMHESKDRSELSQFMDLDPRRIPWCAAFVNAVLASVGLDGSPNLMARSFLNIGVKVRKPAEGDIVILTRGANPASGHVGFYIGESPGFVHVLGGNQSYGRVSITPYPKSKVLGYRRLAVD
jgi:uncharacterized protein (TIGR02594 family)